MDKIYRLYNNYDVISLKNEADKTIIEGYAAHFGDANLNDERVDSSSFDTFFTMYGQGKIKPFINYNHQIDKQIGGVDSLVTDSTGLYITAHLNNALPFVKDWVIPNIEAGDLRSFSTEGFIGGGYDGIIEYEDGTYFVKDFILTAVAVVQTPADWKSEFSIANDYRLNKLAGPKSKWYLM